MHVLALVPARRGSKRLPAKNKLLLGDMPLFCWTLDAALNVSEINSVLVSTDDQEIMAIARTTEAIVPWLRPSCLSTDNARSVDVALHALDWYEENHCKVDALLLLQPTSPFRRLESIVNAIRKFEESGGVTVITVSPSKSICSTMFEIVGENLYPVGAEGAEEIGYSPTGSIYLISPKKLRATKTFFEPPMLPLVIKSKREAIDIDTKYDFDTAKKLL